MAQVAHRSSGIGSGTPEIFVGPLLPAAPETYKLFVVGQGKKLYKHDGLGYVPAYQDVSDSANEVFIGATLPLAPGTYKLFIVETGNKFYKHDGLGYVPAV